MMVLDLSSPPISRLLAVEMHDHPTCEIVYAADQMRATEPLRELFVEIVVIEFLVTNTLAVERLAALKKDLPHIPFVVLGNDDNIDEYAFWISSGAQDYLATRRIDRFSLERAFYTAQLRMHDDDTLFIQSERAQITLNSIGDAVLTTDTHCNVTYLNAAAERISGWTAITAVGKGFSEVLRIVDADTQGIIQNPVRRAIDEDKPVSIPPHSVLLRRDGSRLSIEDSASPIHARDGATTGAVMVFRDVTKSRSMMDRLAHLAHHDHLTGLPNRALLFERLKQALPMVRRHDRRLAVLFLDIDHFKEINDSMGHAGGDMLLMEIARRLSNCIRMEDTVGRLGGDEFVVLLSEVDDTYDVMQVAEKLRRSVSSNYSGALSGVTLSTSIGISIFPEDGLTAEDLVKNADVAMYHAKADGRNGSRLYSEHMARVARQNAMLRHALTCVVRRRELVLHYQPIVDLKSGSIVAAEALIRWNSPDRGLIAPAEFIGLAEKTGIINEIGQWTLREACTQALQWITAPSFSRVSVNISVVELLSPGFAARVSAILRETGLDPSYLELEVTETAVIGDIDRTLTVFRELNELGVRLAMDDFGTGYSSLSRLLELPFNTLKVDMSFVQEAVTNPKAAMAVNAVVGIGKSMNLCVVAEGIESIEQLAFLENLECELGQGYLFSKPVHRDNFANLLLVQSSKAEAYKTAGTAAVDAGR